ncbi:MAG: beta-ketoacyl-ACP synthase II [Thermodesulfovibrionales bacterium]|nr:beta-ketoacyl-ACP synthase II [Thermodesulfovibrionales bacterium]
MKRVVVTGIGAVSPLGNTFQSAWTAAKAGISGIGSITRFDATHMRWKIAGELKGFDPGRFLSPKEVRRLDPFVHYAVAAAMMAAEDAELFGKAESHQVKNSAVVLGSSRGGISTMEQAVILSYETASARGKRKRSVSPYLMPATTTSMASSYVAQKLGLQGSCLGISNACASGTNAIGEAFRLVKHGLESLVFCGGAEAPLCSICIEGYGSAGALSERNDSTASRPFDRTRDGFVLSEGACVLVLEEHSQACKRGVRIYGEIVGYGNTSDAFHQTIPSPEGEARAIRNALTEAGLRPGDIGCINAHGTATVIGDRVETRALKVALGSSAYSIPVTSLKSMTGHMLASSGAFEAAMSIVSMNEGVILPTVNLEEKDAECDLDYVTELREKTIEYAVSNSFGFGGVNAILIFRGVRS